MKRTLPAILFAFCSFSLAQAAAPAPEGKWLVEDIGGKGVIDTAQTTLEFGADSMVSGSGGCNRYTGKATIDKTAISFSPMASTRMACSPALMDQEHKFFQAMETVKSWKIEEGKLLLLDNSEKPVIRLAQSSNISSITIEVPGVSTVDRMKMSYLCGRVPVEAEYINAGTNALANLTIGGEFVIAANVVSASGAKYAGKQFIWWTRGDEADLYDLTRGEDAKPVSCKKTD
jgi:Heat shock protein